MPEVLQELTESQSKLLDLLFLEENKDTAISGKWTPLMIEAGYSSGASKGNAMGSKLFREEFETRVANYQSSLQLQAVYVVEGVLSGENLSPLSQLQLVAAKDTMDRSKNLVKRSETTISTDAGVSVILLPPKDSIEDDEG
ncbi:MAG: hypothetical protein QQN63_00035 [Nitrosopumilus sp.]